MKRDIPGVLDYSRFNAVSSDSGHNSSNTSSGLVESVTSADESRLRALNARKALVFESRASRLLRVYKSVSKSAELHQDRVTAHGFRCGTVMVTLTYRPEVAWGPRHISEFLECVRHWTRLRRMDCRYVWVAELQKNGRVHYHVLFWLPKGLTLPKPDKQGWWRHGMSRIEWARKAVGYLVKYTSKGGDVAGLWFPKGCRLSGFGGLRADERELRSWWVLPRYQRSRCDPEDRAQRKAGGGWISRVTGEVWPPGVWPVVGRNSEVLPC